MCLVGGHSCNRDSYNIVDAEVTKRRKIYGIMTTELRSFGGGVVYSAGDRVIVRKVKVKRAIEYHYTSRETDHGLVRERKVLFDVCPRYLKHELIQVIENWDDENPGKKYPYRKFWESYSLVPYSKLTPLIQSIWREHVKNTAEQTDVFIYDSEYYLQHNLK